MCGWLSAAIARLLVEAIGVGSRELLDGDDSAQPRVSRFPHLAHPAGPEGREDFVWAEASAGLQGHGSRVRIIAVRLGAPAGIREERDYSASRLVRKDISIRPPWMESQIGVDRD